MTLEPPTSTDVTRLLARASDGDRDAMASLFDVLYRELRRLAVAAMRAERRDHTLQPTALVHEAFLRLADDAAPIESRHHFFGVAAIAMRRILVEHARARHAAKRGGHAPRVPLDEVDPAIPLVLDDIDIEALDAALTQLAALDARQARIVELRFFAGLTVEETADVVGLSARTVKREWQLSRAWLRREMARLDGLRSA
ncbi:MAG: sigma-70 family RNA polymerase sigma factor [Acidobacteria bacterium]|nr:sigma-70 family RNA polymerase sigma factor [Acidobacteriota bacterium]